MDYAQFANSCGGVGFRIEQEKELEEKMQQAFMTSKPTIIDVAIEDKAPLPGKIGYEQAVHYSEFLIKNFFKNKKIEFPDLDETIERLSLNLPNASECLLLQMHLTLSLHKNEVHN